MKSVAILLFLGSLSWAHAQSESRTEKKYQRYENGVLVEDNYYLEENGQVVAGEDFEMPDFSAKQLEMETRMSEMNKRMEEMQQRSESMMQTRQAEMDLRMQQMQQRASETQQRIELKMQEMQQRMNSQQQSAPQQAPSSSSLGTVYKT